MDLRDIIYRNTDPCIDGYYSFRRQHVIFGARRITPTETVLDVITRNYSPLPADRDLGIALLAELTITQRRLRADSPLLEEIASGRYRPVKVSAVSGDEFEKFYWPFGVWTKQSQDVPVIIGAPLSNRYPESMNRRPVAKPISPEQMGSALRVFLEDLTRYLGDGPLR